MVCLTIGGVRQCGTPARDSFLPRWSATFPTTAGALQAGIVVEYVDDDGGTAEAICPTFTVRLQQHRFDAGSGLLDCGNGDLTYQLRPQ